MHHILRMSVLILFLFNCNYRDETCDVLAVVDWGQKLAFYQLSGKQVSQVFGINETVCNLHYYLIIQF